ncbi:MAG: hypothetical protein ACKO2F_01800 [Cyanobacteriota bacterium]
MNLRALLLLPVLLPLLAALGVGVLNRGEAVRLRLLLWTTPSLPLGSLILLGAGGGAAVGAGSALLALVGAGPSDPLRRRLRRPAGPQGASGEAEDGFGPEPEPFRPQPFRPESSRPEPSRTEASRTEPWPARDPYAPAPTVSVPYRVVRPQSSPVTTDAGDDRGRDDDGSW